MPNETKPPTEGKGFPPMMKKMMEMCCTGEVNPRAICEEMTASPGKVPDASGRTMPDCCRPRAPEPAPEAREK